MLEFEGDVENTFCRNFTVESEWLGETIVNDLKGVGHTESKVVAACAYALAKYPNHIQDVSSRPEIHTDKLKKYPHWLAKSKVPKSSASGDRSIRSYKSKRSLGALWNYMEYKLGLGFGI